MPRHLHSRKESQQRLLLAQAAARIMSESGIRDFATAKRKAAEKMGLHNTRNLPANEEIQAALHDYQQLFQHSVQEQQLAKLRTTALQAMRLLSSFSPRVVGPVLHGTADQHTPIYLHLFADTCEEVSTFLMQHKIPFEQAERRVLYPAGRQEHYPLLRFFAGDHAIELTVFPPKAQRQPPLSPVDGKPMHRATLKELQRRVDDAGELP